ncbi:uncharacterized protein B0H18DRAFT_460135 [Fomitopsis serialis]|uniref:uncharacterized protein n=1 Tax=Fomitopsis serialis TaxID=139415 RepID=UPI0020073AD0|nr:uncharacterized protein B0H18DRAFT_460135 [Neoantrodia serialis]KAH9923687.1 hypothetical protein B0H18DRAFT_460135 [Neoantrodia serialis]
MAGCRVTENRDVLREIFQHLDPFVDPFGDELPKGWPVTRYQLERRRTLCRAARASRAISECALDVLWKHLSTLTDLFKVIPSLQQRRAVHMDIRDVMDGVERTEWNVSGSITTDDWRRFNGYARRVRALDVSWRPVQVGSKVIEWVSTFSNGRPLLPSLLELTITPGQPLESGVISLISPTILSLAIRSMSYYSWFKMPDYPAHRHALEQVIQHVSSACPNVEEVDLGDCHDTETLLLLSKCRHLRQIRLSRPTFGLDTRLLREWSRIPHLTELSLDLPRDDPVTEALAFPALQKIRVSCSMQKPTISFFQHCSTPALSYLSLTVYDRAEADPYDLLECLRVVSLTVADSSSFRHFILDRKSVEKRGRISTSPRALIDIVRPLCQLGQLETVHLSPPACWNLFGSDAEVEEMVSNWPNLLSLRIDLGSSVLFPPDDIMFQMAAQYFAPMMSRLRAGSLVAIAKACPRLQDLTLLCDLRDLSLAALDDSPSHHPLREIRLLSIQAIIYSPEEAQLNAEFIDRLFPNLILDELFLARSWMWGGTLSKDVLKRMRNLQQERTGEKAVSSATGVLLHPWGPSAQNVPSPAPTVVG